MRKLSALKKLIIFSVFCLVLGLTACGETEDDTITREDVEAFLSEDDDSDAAMQGTSTGTEADASDSSRDQDSNDAENGDAGATSESGNTDLSEPVPEYNGLTAEQYEALPLEEQDKVRDAARKKVTPGYESLILPEYRELYDYNNAVIGYIYIDGTTIDAPVLQTLADYEYYLHRDIDGVESEPGCIILDADSEIGIGTKKDGYASGYEPSQIQLVHGHNMRNGTMFGSLLKYEDRSYAESHAAISYDSLYEHRDYEIICAFYSRIYPEDSEEFKYYISNQWDLNAEYDYWWSNISDMALYIRDVEHDKDSEYIILSTCAYQTTDGRFAVLGVRKDENENE